MEAKAHKLGATEFGTSNVKGKRFYVMYNGKKINFGSDVGSTFIDHHDVTKRNAWRARHSQIQNANGQYVYKLKTSPAYWSWHLLW